MRIWLTGWVVGLMAMVCAAQPAPRITGLAGVAFYAADLKASDAFYRHCLGYGGGIDRADELVIDISHQQSLWLIRDAAPGDRLAYVAFETDDAQGLRKLLASRGVAVPAEPAAIPDSDIAFNIMDPDGHVLRFVQQMSNRPKLPGESAISTHMSHAGILVSSLPQSMKFYRDQLGFTETWRGSRNNKILSWVNLKVPDGNDYLEFMLYSQLPPPTGRGTQHHICLEVPDVKKAWEILQTRTLPKECKAPTEMKTGVNGKRQINLYDPDGTRIEIMERGTFDGKPVPPSTAPAPQGEPLLTELLHSKAAEGVPPYAPAK